MRQPHRTAAILVAAVVIALASPAVGSDTESADDAQPTAAHSESTSWALETGANVRTDLGVRALRLDIAWRTPAFRGLLVVDPMFWTDGRTTTDLIGFWRANTIEPLVGWRLNTVPLVDGSQFQHNLVMGAALDLPTLFDGRIGGQWGIEMSTMIAKHSGGVAGDRFRSDSARHYIDRIRFGMFARFFYQQRVE